MIKKLLLISLLILAACSSQITSVEINDQIIPVETAITAQQKTDGLMFRTNLTGGMLFTYDNEAPRNFWMKNTLIPLDIIFIDNNMKITAIHYAIPCVKDPCKVYSAEKAQYVLEVNGNFTKEYNIKVGDLVLFSK